jgi:hypothetical protein
MQLQINALPALSTDDAKEQVFLDLSSLAKALQSLLNTGGSTDVLEVGEITIYLNKDQALRFLTAEAEARYQAEYPTWDLATALASYGGDLDYSVLDFHTLLNEGTPLLDAVIYLSFEHKHKANVSYQVHTEEFRMLPLREVEKALAYVVLMCLLTGSWPKVDIEEDKVPRIIKTMGYEDSIPIAKDVIASFDYLKLPTDLVKYFDYNQIGKSIRGRIGLGIAGLRDLGALGSMPIPTHLSKDRVAPYMHAMAMAGLPVAFDHCAAARSQKSLSEYGSIRQGVQDLMIEVFSHKAIEELCGSKKMYKGPGQKVAIRKSKQSKYTLWSGDAHVEMTVFDKTPATKKVGEYTGTVLMHLPAYVAAVTHPEEYGYELTRGQLPCDWTDGGELNKDITEGARKAWRTYNAAMQRDSPLATGYYSTKDVTVGGKTMKGSHYFTLVKTAASKRSGAILSITDEKMSILTAEGMKELFAKPEYTGVSISGSQPLFFISANKAPAFWAGDFTEPLSKADWNALDWVYDKKFAIFRQSGI